MINITGFILPYKINRKLTGKEKEWQFFQGRPRKGASSISDFDKTIKMNSTYLEMVDKHYLERGEISLIMLPSFMTMIYLFLNSIFFSIDEYNKSYISTAFLLLSFMVIFSFSFSVFCFYFLYKEWLTLTHCPVRYNRRTQMVHAFKFNGDIISVPWGSVFFTAKKSVGTISSSWMINGHILAEDGETVIDTFGTGIDGMNRTELSRYWEFIRCYMEEDCLPELADTIRFCLPISDRRESYVFGLQYMLRLESRFEWLFLILKVPFSLLTSIHRYFLMRTCKVPEWTEEIENDCQIIADDPINISAKNNPKHMWRLVLVNQVLEDYNQFSQREKKAQLRIKKIIEEKYHNKK